MIKYLFRDVLEHDIDMLIIEEFACSDDFPKIFLSKIDVENANLILTWQSKTDAILGESDITVIFSRGKKKIALLIEDKIDAIAMPEQPSRYVLRGEKGIKEGDYDEYYIFIVAPQAYLNNNEKAKEYPNNVSYEEIKEYFERSLDSRKGFKIAQIDFAIDKQKRGYQIIKDALVTDFWMQYIKYKNRNYPLLNLITNSNIKPTRGVWAAFKTNDGKTIYHKSNKGWVDLTFNGCAGIIEDLKEFIGNIIGNYYEQGYVIVTTGKSCAVRIKVPVIDFSQSFEEQISFVNKSFDAVEKLCVLSEKLDISGINHFLNKA